jgi:hypothetical protein
MAAQSPGVASLIMIVGASGGFRRLIISFLEELASPIL